MHIAYGRASFELNANLLNSFSMHILIHIRVDRPLVLSDLFLSPSEFGFSLSPSLTRSDLAFLQSRAI